MLFLIILNKEVAVGGFEPMTSEGGMVASFELVSGIDTQQSAA